MKRELENAIGRQFGEFRVLEEIGRGAMGVVYLAEQPSLNRTVALKVLPRNLNRRPQTLERFKRETSAIARLHHPNIVPIYGVGEEEGNHYYAMEYLEGLSLKELIYTERLSPERAAEIARDIARALSYAHENGVIHRDIKPANIMMVEGGQRPMVTDFGLARQEDLSKMTMEGVLLGTPTHMAPEQTGGSSSDLDHRIDIYALGITLYEMLTGRLPFYAENLQDLLTRIKFEKPDRPDKTNPEVPRDLATICMMAIEKQPDARYQTADEFAEDLTRFLKGQPIAAKTPSVMELVARKARKNLLATILGVCLFLILLVVGVVFFVSSVRRSRALASLRSEVLTAEEEGRHREALELLGRLKNLDPEDPFVYQQEPRLKAAIEKQEAEERLEARRREARQLIDEGNGFVEKAERLTERVRDFRSALARSLLRNDQSGKEETLERLQRANEQVEESYQKAIHRLTGALALSDEDSRADAMLGQIYLALHRRARWQERNEVAELYRELALRHDPEGTVQRALTAPGRLAVTTAPPAISFTLIRHDPGTGENKSLRTLTTPAELEEVPAGSYSLRSRKRDLVLPFVVSPEETTSLELELPSNAGPEGFVYVAPGPFIYGGDPGAIQAPPRVPIDLPEGYWMARRELTIGDYLAYLNAVPKKEAFRNLPRIALYRIELRGGSFALALNNDSDAYDERTPILGLSMQAIRDYCAWRSQESPGWTFRLPTSLEWVKAARGPDGRIFPWGNDWAEGKGIARKDGGEVFPAYVGTHPRDVSIYGILDLAGNVSEWTSTPFEGRHRFRTCHGITGFPFQEFHRISSRYPVEAFSTPPRELYLGVRLVAVRE